MQQQQKLRSQLRKENKQIKHYITLQQWNAINSLAIDNSIVIKEADKGCGFVIMNTDFYKRQILEMLTDGIIGKIDELINSHTKRKKK